MENFPGRDTKSQCSLQETDQWPVNFGTIFLSIPTFLLGFVIWADLEKISCLWKKTNWYLISKGRSSVHISFFSYSIPTIHSQLHLAPVTKNTNSLTMFICCITKLLLYTQKLSGFIYPKLRHLLFSTWAFWWYPSHHLAVCFCSCRFMQMSTLFLLWFLRVKSLQDSIASTYLLPGGLAC